MKIEAIRTYRKFMPLRQAWEVGAGGFPGKEHVLVAIRAIDGQEGYGAMSPLPSFSGETGVGAEHVIRDLIGPRLVGHDVFDLEGIHRLLEMVIYGNNLAKSAVDIALFDLQGKLLNMPVHALLGGKVREQVDLCWAIAVSDIDAVVAEAAQKVEQGFRSLKLKVGRDLPDTLRRLQLVREAVGPAVGLRLDINQHYTVDESIRLVNEAAPLHLEYVEQPAPRWDLDALARVSHAVPVPVMVDEGVFSLHDIIAVVKKDAASIVNLKVGKLGGLYNARKAAAICETAGLRGMIGCMLESGLAMLAGAHLATALQPIDLPCELIGHQLYNEDFVDMAPFDQGGKLVVNDRPGLGFPQAPAVFR